MDLRDYLRVLRKRWRLITLCALLALGAAAAVTLATTPTYQAQVQLFVSAKDSAGDVSGAYQGSLFTQQRVKSYADIVNNPPVTSAVIKQLNLPLTPDELAKKISASAPLDTVLINVDVTDPSPARARDIANAVGEQFGQLVNKLETPNGSSTSPVKVSVVKPADLPTTPVSPRTKINLALGLLVGLAIGVGAAVLRETLDTSVKSGEELQKSLDLATLGVIAHDPDAPKRPLIVQVDPHSSRAEAFRQLRTNLQFIDVDRAPKSIVVTSSVPEEGKSTTAANLAITLAQAGLRVILVEGDLRRPRLADYLGMEGAVGLTSVLIGRVELRDALQPWGDGLLRLLPGGPTPPNPSELLGSQGMADLLERLEADSDLVLIDAPPLLPVTDAAVLATLTSGALVVVRMAKTRREQLARAVESLRAVDAHVYGAVLNMAPTKGPDAYRYGYGYTYNYRSRQTPGPAVTPRPALQSPPAAGGSTTVLPDAVSGLRGRREG